MALTVRAPYVLPVIITVGICCFSLDGCLRFQMGMFQKRSALGPQ